MRLAKHSSRKVAIVPAQKRKNETLYPNAWSLVPGLALRSQFEVFSVGSVGRGIRAKVPFVRGTAIARFTGQLMSEVLQHTLQVSPTSHVHDPHFIGLFSHSCAPNCLLDMERLEVLALVDIAVGDTLSVDYALTEDVLYRQFPCGCGAANCRHWITGRRDPVNDEGLAYLADLAASE